MKALLGAATFQSLTEKSAVRSALIEGHRSAVQGDWEVAHPKGCRGHASLFLKMHVGEDVGNACPPRR